MIVASKRINYIKSRRDGIIISPFQGFKCFVFVFYNHYIPSGFCLFWTLVWKTSRGR